jgi:hypothetical protein
MVRGFPRLQVSIACFSCSPPDLNSLDPYFTFMYMHNNHCHQVTAHLQSNYYYYYYYYYLRSGISCVPRVIWLGGGVGIKKQHKCKVYNAGAV